MANTLQSEKERLYKLMKYELGYPSRKVELEEEQMDGILEIVIQDYAERVQNWLVDNYWGNLQNRDITKTDLSFWLSTRTLDYQNSFSFAYSKIQGLQQTGNFELKKDYIVVEAGKQVYSVPAGREINEVLYVTPSMVDRALFSNYGGVSSFGAGLGAVGYTNGYMNGTGFGNGSMGGYFIAPAFDVLLTAQDYTLKNKMLHGDLQYKVTAGPNGTKLIHLISTPGSKMSFTSSGPQASGNYGIVNHEVWYHYYDVNPGNVDECRSLNPDIIRLPNEVPLDRLSYSDFNEPTKGTIRQLFTAKCKQIIGGIRGRYSGYVGGPDANAKMDYEMLLNQGKNEYDDAMKRLDERLEKLTTTSQLEKKAKEAEDLNKALSFNPNGIFMK